MNPVIPQHTQLGELAHIVDEVNEYGFYAVKLREFFPADVRRDEAMYIIYLIAKQTNLKVSLNIEQDLCVFERERGD